MPELKPADVADIVERFYGAPLPRVFVETGTFQGDGVERLRTMFAEVHSFELDHSLHARAVERFRGAFHVHCHLGDSAGGLASLVSAIDEPVFFWLDAHYSGPGTAYGAEEVPLFRELRSISARRHRDIVVIDDWHLSGRRGESPDSVLYRAFDYDWRHVTLGLVQEGLGRRWSQRVVRYDEYKLVVLTNRGRWEIIRDRVRLVAARVGAPIRPLLRPVVHAVRRVVRTRPGSVLGLAV